MNRPASTSKAMMASGAWASTRLTLGDGRLRLFAFGEVANKGAEAPSLAGCQGHDGKFDGKLAPVLAQRRDFDAAVHDGALPGGDQMSEPPGVRFAVAPRDDEF